MTRTVLLVDDDAMVRRSEVRALIVKRAAYSSVMNSAAEFYNTLV